MKIEGFFPFWNHDKIGIVSSFCFIWIPMIWVYGHFKFLIILVRWSSLEKNVRFWHLKTVPVLKGSTRDWRNAETKDTTILLKQCQRFCLSIEPMLKFRLENVILCHYVNDTNIWQVGIQLIWLGDEKYWINWSAEMQQNTPDIIFFILLCPRRLMRNKLTFFNVRGL